MRWRSVLTASVSLTMLVAVVSPSAASPSKPDSPATGSRAAGPEADAVRRAAESGRSVEITDRNTETSQVLANPDGTFTLKSNARPVRVKKDGAWRGIDTTLRANADGTVTPVAVAADMTFSGGGATPVLRLAEGDASVSMGWPGPLPKPVLNGNTATYPNVLPGVDLKMVADNDTYTQTLVVRDAEAAKNPALAAIKLTVSARNLTLKSGQNGLLTASDPTGKVVFSESTPMMWDSHRDDSVGPAPTAVFSGSGKRTPLRSQVTQAAGTTEMTLVPEPAALTGPGVTYPVYIDPVLSRNRSTWAEVTENGWHYYNTGDPAQVGRCFQNGNCNGLTVARSFFNFNIADLMPRNGYRPKLFGQSFTVGQLHAANKCTAQPTDLYAANGFDSNISWGGPVAYWLDRQSSAAGDNCGGGRPVRFLPNTLVQNAVNGVWPSINFALLAQNEGEQLQWKIFDNNPLLEVNFSFPPNPATDVHVSNEVTCDGKAVTSDRAPTLYARATDNNSPPLNVDLNFAWRGPDPLTRVGWASAASGAVGALQSGSLSDGDYDMSVGVLTSRGGDQEMAADSRTSYSFTVRATPPAAAPVVDPSVDYPADYWGAPNGTPGVIAVHDGGAANIVGYSYTFAGSGTESVPKTTDCMYNKPDANGGWIPRTAQGTDWIPIPAGLSAGYHTLLVRSFDDAHNMSPESTPYTFYVAPNAGLASQRVEAETLAFTQPPGQNKELNLNPRNDIGLSGGNRVFFKGDAAGQSFTLTVNSGVDTDFDIGVGLVKGTDYGQIALEFDGRPFDSTIDGYDPRLHVSHHPLGIRHLNIGPHTLKVTFTGTNSQSVGTHYVAAVDYITLTQTHRFEAEDGGQVAVSQPAGQTVPVTSATGPYSQSTALVFQASAANQSVDLAFRTLLEADFAMGVGLGKRSDQGQFRVSVDGVPLQRTDATPLDGYSANSVGFYQPLGGAHLSAGAHKLTITVVGKNAASTGYQAIVDYLTAVPVNNVTTASFPAAMNNDGISADGTVANFDLFSNGISAQTLAAAGYAPGSVVRINGAAFTMPAATAAGDNVIAIGQTIPLPAGQQVKATAIGMLVAASCGNTGDATATIRYTDGSTQDTKLPAVDDWALGRTLEAAFVLPYRNMWNKTSDSSNGPRLHAVFLPADPTKTVQAVTLPSYGSSLLPLSCSPALHVFSMAPRPIATGWVGTWAAPSDMSRLAPALADKTLRTVLKPSTTGVNVRVKVANPSATAPVTIDAATAAAQTGTGGATVAAPVRLTFGGSASVTLAVGGEAVSDPVAYPTGGSGLAVSIHLPNAVAASPLHASGDPTFLAAGNATADSSGTPFTTRLDGSRYVSAVEVSTSDNRLGTVAVLGDQYTAGESSWVSGLPARLTAGGVPVPGGLVNVSRSGVAGTSRWKLNGNGTDSVGGFNATASGGVTWSTDHGGSAVFDGTGALTAGTVLSGDFTVSAWMKVNEKVAQTVATQGGFALGTDGTKWSMTVAGVRTLSVTDIEPGRWTHLVVTYDAATHFLHMYVDSFLQSYAIGGTFAGGGSFVIGSGLKGSVADVRTFQGVGSYSDAGLLYWGEPAYGPMPGLGAPAAVLSRQTLDTTVLNQPQLRTVVVALGANDLLCGYSTSGAEQNLTQLLQSTSATGIRNTRRTDGNFVRVVITTIPAMGLADNDPREQRRKQVNADLLTNYTRYGADDVIDTATPTTDPQHPNQLKPEYVTAGTLNPAYHNAISDIVANAITKFPPDAQL
jgi:hypothetical protein